MKKLLAANFYCLRKSKLALVLLIIAVVLPLFMSLLYVGLKVLADYASTEGSIPFTMNAKVIIADSFSISGNMGLIMPIFTGIIVGSDLANGTLRNKIIVGHSKTKIYFSHLISSIVFHLFIGIVYAAFMAGFALIFFRYGQDIDGKEIVNLIYFYVTGLLAYVFIASLVSAFALNFKSPAATILITILVCMAFGLGASLIGLVDYSNYKYLVYLIPSFANGRFTSRDGIETVVFIEGIISYVILIAAFVTTGAIIFNKKDIK